MKGKFEEFRAGGVDDPVTEMRSDPSGPMQLELVGSYALRVRWSDGHGTGLFTWGVLKQWGE